MLVDKQIVSPSTAPTLLGDKSPKASSQERALSCLSSDGLGSQDCANCLVKHLKRFDVNFESGYSEHFFVMTLP